MKKHIFLNLLFLISVSMTFPQLLEQQSDQAAISLAGNWRVALDVYKTGTEAKWYEQGLPREADLELLGKIFYKGIAPSNPETIYLPGTDNDGHLGKKLVNTPEIKDGLERLYAYDGILWVEKEITIPENLRNTPVRLFLERVPGISKVWWNGIFKGESNDYAVPHICEITSSAVPGRYRLTIMVNNTPPPEWTHHVITASGARWNGIIGKIELQVNNRIYIKNTQVYPDIRSKKAIVEINVKNTDNKACKGIISLTVRRKGLVGLPFTQQNVDCKLEPDSCNLVKTEISIPEPVVLWDEFNPALYELKATLNIQGDLPDTEEICFGMRELSVKNTRFMLNGEPIFLRGNHDGGQFPLKADPAMDKATWLHILGIYKQYGLNHVRFHTWCPPEAAFQAADELGLLFQIEMASSHYSELLPIMTTYGNHPSFGMVSLTNEQDHNEYSRQILVNAKKYDSRHLYCCTSCPWDTGCIDDFYVSAYGVDNKRTVGIEWGGGDLISVTRFNTDAPETASDYRDAIKGINAPMVSHEMGQWAIYPDLSEIPRYNGMLKNLNYERIKENLREKGLLSQASDFVKASGKLSLLLYKEEIEATLRTPQYGGFQLLDLHDYQGQGVSIVGILNAFWESKGLITPEEFREFCSPAVPLMRMKKRIWTQSESFDGVAELAYFGPALENEIQPVWRITDKKGNVLMQGKLGKKKMQSGGLISLGVVHLLLSKLPVPAKLQFVLEVPQLKALNRWDFWLYPDKADAVVPSDVQVFTGWGDDVQKALSNGQKVLLFPKPEDLPGSRVGCFTTIFWNPLMKRRQIPQTMGILCDPAHAVFGDFPTEFHTNWQWWDLTINSRAMVLDKTPFLMKPLVQVVDNFVTNKKLGLLFETKVGDGKLIVCSIDLDTNLDKRPVARQFRHSLLQYMNGVSFNPEFEMNLELLNSLFNKF